MKIEIKILNKNFYTKLKLDGGYYDLPTYRTDGAAGVDLVCTKDINICPQERVLIPTGLAIWIGGTNVFPFPSVMAMIVPRSSMGHNRGLILGNTVGIIDEDYQGELIVSAWNSNSMGHYAIEPLINTIQLKAGERFAQLIFVPVIKAKWDIVEEFSENTKRGNGGFGSTD